MTTCDTGCACGSTECAVRQAYQNDPALYARAFVGSIVGDGATVDGGTYRRLYARGLMLHGLASAQRAVEATRAAVGALTMATDALRDCDEAGDDA